MRYHALLCASLAAILAGCLPPSTAKKAPATAPATPAKVDPVTPAAPTERVVAEAGVAKRGQSTAGETGILVEPVKQLFRFEQKAVFDLQIKPALNLYQASTGAFPKTHEEFMEKIIKANNIKLPVLPEGQTYVFDPEEGQLMVER